MHDVSDHQHGTDIDLALLESIRTAPAWLTSSERLLLFSLIYSLRPRRYLEIGILFGGASLIVTKAMDASKSGGRLVLVDPEPQVAPATWAQIAHRSVILEGRSPEVLERAAAEAGGGVRLGLHRRRAQHRCRPARCRRGHALSLRRRLRDVSRQFP